MNVDKRFMVKVDKGDSSSCWLWHGCLNNKGYGTVTRRRHGKKRNYLAHRYSYELRNGPVPDGLCVLHKCDIPRCVNPDHLFLGTQADNIKDCVAKGRSPRGEQHGRAKLSDADVISILMFINLGAKQRDISEAFGVSRSIVSDIKCGRTYR